MFKESVALYTVNQLMKMEDDQVTNLHVKSSTMNVQSSEPESLMKETAHTVFGGNTRKK